MTPETRGVLIWVHQRNIERHFRLLTTELTEHERQYIYRRMADERRELEQLGAVRSPGRRRTRAAREALPVSPSSRARS